MGVPSTFSSRTKTARPLASWPVTTVRTFIPCLFSSGLVMVTFLDSCNSVFIFNFPFVLLKSFSAKEDHRRRDIFRLTDPAERRLRFQSFAEVAQVGDGEAGPVEERFGQPVVAHSVALCRMPGGSDNRSMGRELLASPRARR